MKRPSRQMRPKPLTTGGLRWWVLITQFPTRPAYVRVKLARRLQRLGAVAIKNAVYALPFTEQAQEDFQWLLREIREDGGEASLLESRLIDGLNDAQVQALFVEARAADYRQLLQDLQGALPDFQAAKLSAEQRKHAEVELVRFRRRFDELISIELFPTGHRGEVESTLRRMEERMKQPERKTVGARERPARYRARTWVTRKGIKIDRIASAWLIRRFIDPKARFKFVQAEGYKPSEGELRFDMFEAELTHEGDRCTFETLLVRTHLEDRALEPIAQIVHDLDIKDGKFDREEASGVARVIQGIVSGTTSDEERLERGGRMFEELYQAFKRGPA